MGIKKQITAKMKTMVFMLVLTIWGAVGIASQAEATLNPTSTTSTSPDTLTYDGDITFQTAGAYAFLDSNTDQVMDTITVTQSGTLWIEDSANAAKVIDFEEAVAITSGKTWTIGLGMDTAGVAGEEAHVEFGAAITGAGGILVINSTSGSVQGSGSSVDFQAAVTLGEVTLTSGTGGAAAGSTLAIEDFDAESTITTLNINSGGGSVSADQAGGAMTVAAVQSIINGTTLNVVAGNGGNSTGADDAGNGGALTITTWAGAIKSVTTNLTSGSGGIGHATNTATGGNGGALDMPSIASVITSTTVNITSGSGGNGLDDVAASTGGAGGAMASLDFDGAVTSILNITGGDGGNGGNAPATDGANGGAGGVIGATDVTFAAQVIGATTIKGGDGGNAGTSAAGVGGVGGAGAAVSTTGTGFVVGITGALTVTGGAAGTSSAADGAAGEVGGVGGAVIITDSKAQIGDVILTGGAGGATGAGNATAAGGAGANGGAVTVNDFTTSLTGDLTIQGGAGSSGGAAGTGGVGGAGADGGAATLSAMTAYAGATAAGGTIQVLGGDAGSAGASATGDNGGDGGAGGLAVITDMNGTPDIATLTLTGGDGGNGSAAGTSTAGIGAGVAGTAIVGITGGATGDVTTINITGGNAGDGGAPGTSAVGGSGTAGAVATLVYDNVALRGQAGTGSTTITVTGGAGGDGGNGGSSSGTGVAGVDGGIATFNFGGTNISANITLDDGTDGVAGTADGGAAGDKGDGGGAVLDMQRAGAMAYTGTILAAADGEGSIVTSGGSMTVVGNIGTSSKELDDIFLNHAGGLITDGDIYAKDITLSAAGAQLNLNSVDAAVVSGAIGTGANGTEDMTTGTNALYTFKGAIGKNSAGADQPLIDILTGAGSVQTFESTINSVTLGLNATSTQSFGGAVTLTGALAVANGATITLLDTIVAGETVFTTVTAGSSFTTAATVNMPQNFNSGTITLVDDTGTTGAADAALLTVNAGVLATYTAGVGGDSSEIYITAVKKSSSTIAAALGVSVSAAKGLDAATTAAAGDAAVSALMTTVLLAGGTAATEMAEQVQGSVDGLGATSGAATASTGAAAISVGSSRMAALRSGTAYASRLGTGFNAGSGTQSNNPYASTMGTGFSAGSGSQSNSMWMKPFASFGDQGLRDGIKGYEADTYGLAIGGDTKLNANSIAGLGFSYANTDVDGKGAGKSHSDISSYQLTAYADYTENEWYVEGLVGYAYNDMDTSRKITVTDATAKGNTNSGQYMVSVNAGMPMKIGAEGMSGTYFTPTIGLNVTHVDNKAYTETGAGVLNLTVTPEDITMAKASLGGRLHASVESSDGIFVPELRAKLLYDMAGDDGSSSNTFTGGGATFQVDGMDVAQFATSVGVGFAFSPKGGDLEGMSFGVNYDAEFKDDYTGQSGNFNFRYAF